MVNIIYLTDFVINSTINSANITFPSILVQNAGVYTCLASTPYTQTRITADITVKRESMHRSTHAENLILHDCLFLIANCPAGQVGPLFWTRTRPGQTASQPCFPIIFFRNRVRAISTVNATRFCMKNGTWAQPNTEACSRRE